MIDDPALKENLDRIRNLNKNYKHIACLALIRNSLNVGNENIKNVIKDTIHAKLDTFDKILILMLNNCENQLKNEDVGDVRIFLNLFRY